MICEICGDFMYISTSDKDGIVYECLCGNSELEVAISITHKELNND